MTLELPKPDTNTLTYLRSHTMNHQIWAYGHPDKTLTQLAVDAAYRLECGSTVEWEPGDGTRYVLALIRADAAPWLCFLNLSKYGRGGGMLRLTKPEPDRFLGGTDVGDWCNSTAPVGGWMGVLPLLIAGGFATAPARVEGLDLWAYASRREAAYRAANSDTTPPIHDLDARLGRDIRLMVTQNVAEHPRPEETP